MIVAMEFHKTAAKLQNGIAHQQIKVMKLRSLISVSAI